jgi:hypothetical protein
MPIVGRAASLALPGCSSARLAVVRDRLAGSLPHEKRSLTNDVPKDILNDVIGEHLLIQSAQSADDVLLKCLPASGGARLSRG